MTQIKPLDTESSNYTKLLTFVLYHKKSQKTNTLKALKNNKVN